MSDPAMERFWEKVSPEPNSGCWLWLGYIKIGTYILASEPGTSLLAAGWRLIGERGGGSWTTPSRPRVDKHPTQRKLLFEKEPRP